MKTVILCGGKGTRAYPQTVEVPKPMLEVGGRPVLLHVMEIYARQGFDDFVLAAGYKVEVIAEFAATLAHGWRVEVVDTGVDAGTGERVLRCADRLAGSFFLTYADGLGNVDLAALLRFHRSHPGEATLTTVPLPTPYGTLDLGPGDRVERFTEKPRLADHSINAGFLALDEAVFEHWSGPDLERHVLPSLGAAGRLYAYRHTGFWKSMDTYKDALELTALCADGSPPWFDVAGEP